MSIYFSGSKSKCISLGFEAIIASPTLFRESLKTSGRQIFSAGHLFNITEWRYECGRSKILAKCLREMKITNNPYNVELSLDPLRQLTDVYCSCTAGIDGVCKHASALFIAGVVTANVFYFSHISLHSQIINSYRDIFIRSLASNNS